MKIFLILTIVILVGVVGWLVLLPGASVDTTPSEPESPNAVSQEDLQQPPYTSELITVESPRPQEQVGNPIELSGEARGYWFFEATAPVVVVDWDGRIIGEGYITAIDEWMTESFVPFMGTIEYSLPEDSYSTKGAIIFQKSNPSDLPENDAAIEFPIVLKK